MVFKHSSSACYIVSVASFTCVLSAGHALVLVVTVVDANEHTQITTHTKGRDLF